MDHDRVTRSGTAVEPIDEEEILDGGMPPVVVGETRRRDLWFLGYEQTYLERDVRDLSQVSDLVAFRNILRLAALRSGQILNQSELGPSRARSHLRAVALRRIAPAGHGTPARLAWPAFGRIPPV